MGRPFSESYSFQISRFKLATFAIGGVLPPGSHALNERPEYLYHLLLRNLICAILIGFLDSQRITALCTGVT
jgi:hypothetical protein